MNGLRQPALLGHFLLARKVEGRSPRTLEWYQEALGAFERFCSCQGFDPWPHPSHPSTYPDVACTYSDVCSLKELNQHAQSGWGYNDLFWHFSFSSWESDINIYKRECQCENNKYYLVTRWAKGSFIDYFMMES